MPDPIIIGYDGFGNPIYDTQGGATGAYPVTVPEGAITVDVFGNPIYQTPQDTTVTFESAPWAPPPSTAHTGGASDFSDWLFANMTPEQQAETVARGEAEYDNNGGRARQAPEIAYQASGGDDAYTSPENRLIKRMGQRVQDQDVRQRIELEKLQQLADQSKLDNQAAVDEMGNIIDAQDPLDAAYVQRSRDLATQLGGHRDVANARSDAALAEYGGTLRGLNARNDALVGNLGGVYDDLRNPIAADLALNPEALAAQNEALGFFQGGMNGALDYQSQAAGAYADPKYVAMRDQGLADLYAVSQGSKDVEVGEADPAAYAAARSALDQASELSNPAVTDKENFLYEQARQRWESEMRGVQQAKMSNLRRRGMAGGGAELTSTALMNADVSQKRVLADLAASAGAVDRAGEMLKLKGALATNLNDAGNMLATGNANRQLEALGLYQAGAETAQQSSFDQEYKRGVAADKASADNQATRLSSGIAYGNQANVMQDDATELDWRNKQIEIGERDALWGRATDFTGMALNASAQNSNNAGNLFQGETSVANNNYVRDRDVIQGWDLASQREWTGQQAQTDRRLGVQGAQVGINNTNTGVQSGVIGSNIAGGQWTVGQLNQNDQVQLGQISSDKAALETALASIDAREKAGKTGIAGLPVIGSSDYGLFNLFGAGGVPDYDGDRERVRRQYGGGGMG